MTKRALVLAGGGIAGIAWETGVMQGIADEAPEIAAAVRNADVVLGTSAGSAVGAQLGSALSISELFERQIAAESAEISPGVNIEVVLTVFVEAMSAGNGAARAQQLQRLGKAAAAAETVDPAVRRDVIERRLPSHDWPDHDLRITGVDIDTGELVVFTRESGVSLVDAVEASCAVPAAWPVVTIGGRRFMDGGMGSSVNMIAVKDCDSAVVLVPAPSDSPSPFGAGPGADVRSFAGSACAIYADDASLAAFGIDPLDPACRIPSAQAGRAQGHRVAAEVAAFLA